jgi:MarR family transcriptional regulator, organic hydroperoxide resistance regulator
MRLILSKRDVTMTAIPPLEHHICFSLYSASLAMSALYKRLLDPLALTYPQFITLIALWTRDDQTVGQLGTQLRLESNTLTPLLKRLESAGLVTRLRDAQDERMVRIRLTDAGRTMQGRAGHIPECILQASGIDLPAIIDLNARVVALRDSVGQA